MRWIERLGRRLRVLFRKSRVERDLDDELRAHVEMETEELIRGGMEPGRARREALRRFGGVERTKERVRDERGGRVLEDLVQDLRYGVRSLRKSPGFSVSALMVLALGIGSAVALFGVVDAVLLEPLPYPDAGRLVRVWPARGAERTAFSYPELEDWRNRSTSVVGLGLYSTLPADYVYLGGDAPAELATEWVGQDFFRVLGVAPAAGRTLLPEDEEDHRTVAVISWGLWQRLFGGDPSVVGRALEIDYRTFQVVGVMPQGFTFPVDTQVDLWVPITVVPQDDIPTENRGVRFVGAIGRLAPEATVETARQELGGIARSLEETYPDTNAGISGALVQPLAENTVGDVRSALLVALGAVGFILLLACANVANLLLARGSARAREVALRMSLGAPAGRVVRQLLTESVLLAGMGGVLGLGLAWAATAALARDSAGLLPRAAEIGLDGTVVGRRPGRHPPGRSARGDAARPARHRRRPGRRPARGESRRLDRPEGRAPAACARGRRGRARRAAPHGRRAARAQPGSAGARRSGLRDRGSHRHDAHALGPEAPRPHGVDGALPPDPRPPRSAPGRHRCGRDPLPPVPRRRRVDPGAGARALRARAGSPALRAPLPDLGRSLPGAGNAAVARPRPRPDGRPAGSAGRRGQRGLPA